MCDAAKVFTKPLVLFQNRACVCACVLTSTSRWAGDVICCEILCEQLLTFFKKQLLLLPMHVFICKICLLFLILVFFPSGSVGSASYKLFPASLGWDDNFTRKKRKNGGLKKNNTLYLVDLWMSAIKPSHRHISLTCIDFWCLTALSAVSKSCDPIGRFHFFSPVKLCFFSNSFFEGSFFSTFIDIIAVGIFYLKYGWNSRASQLKTWNVSKNSKLLSFLKRKCRSSLGNTDLFEFQ